MSDAAERILELIHSGVYGVALEEAVVVLRDRLLSGKAAPEALSVASEIVSSRFELPASEVEFDLDRYFHDTTGIGVADYAEAAQREREEDLVEYALSAARRGGPRPSKDWSTGSLNWSFQDAARDSYDPRYVRDVAEINPQWVVTAADFDEFKYRSGSYSSTEGKFLDDLRAELQEIYAEHYEDREDVDFDGMVRLFADDDFYNQHYVARRYLVESFSAGVAAPRL
ncbi:hypothetical protein [Rhizobium leguminosarum]|uniref:hypothetical protein n=1 Tax=Rhizobium leguminosarum TaxID=384 RepID=UPI002E107597|nr:hypothetical protein U8Q02_37285 [Rhizobium leguminosarum]